MLQTDKFQDLECIRKNVQSVSYGSLLMQYTSVKNVKFHVMYHYGKKKFLFNILKPTGYVMHQQFNILKPTGYVMHQQFNIQQL